MTRKVGVLTVLWLILLISPHILQAQEGIQTEAPIIAVSGSSIYAVSPTDDAARLLVERDVALDERLRNEFYIGPAPLLSPVSPDQTHIAYTAPVYEMLEPEFEDQRSEIAAKGPNDLFVVDIASGTQTSVTSQGETLADSLAQYKVSVYSMPTWSLDGQRLYFHTVTSSLRNRAPVSMIESYDVVTGERKSFIDLKTETGMMALYVFEEGVGLLRRTDDQMAFELRMYDSAGTLIRTHALELPDWLGTTNGLMIMMNPVVEKGKYGFGYYAPDGENPPVPTFLDVSSGDTVRLGHSFYPGLRSHTHLDTSFQFIVVDPFGYSPWWVVNPEGLAARGMDVDGVAFQSQLALSPDGDTVAVLRPDEGNDPSGVPLTLMDEEGTRTLEFKADQIQWGPSDYAFVFAPG